MKKMILFFHLFLKEFSILALLISISFFSFYDWNPIIKKNARNSADLKFLMKPGIDQDIVNRELESYSIINEMKVDSVKETNRGGLNQRIREHLVIPEYSLINISLRDANLFDIKKITQTIQIKLKEYYISNRYKIHKKEDRSAIIQYRGGIALFFFFILILFYNSFSSKIVGFKRELSFFERKIDDIKYISFFSLLIFSICIGSAYFFYGLSPLPIHFMGLIFVIASYSVRSKMMALK